MQSTVSEEEILRIVEGRHHDPFHVLGMHPVRTQTGQAIAVRAFLPNAHAVRITGIPAKGGTQDMRQIHPEGFYEAVLKDQQDFFTYQFENTYPGGNTHRTHDPYAFPPVLSDYDIHLFGEGNHLRIYDKLGAHPTVLEGIQGVLFAVWAPNAQRVSVVGDFNGWDGLRHPMRLRGSSGIWEIFMPELGCGAIYKYEIRTPDGSILVKSDPYALRMEYRPQTASIVHSLSDNLWTDAEWMSARQRSDPLSQPMAVYEVHLASWRRVPEEGNRPLTYREIAHDLVDYVVEMGYTHIELLPIMEHPLDESWGYQVTGYYAPTSRHGMPEDLQYLVNHCHNNGIGVILDWVPAHFPADKHSLVEFDGTALYEHADPRQGAHPDWGTLIFNYGRNEVRNFLCANALYWLEKFHVDGLRVDAVASMLYLDYSRSGNDWVPNRYGGRENLEAIAFLRFLNETVYARFPGALMVAEESTAWPGVSRPLYLGGLGFGFKWNMGWMNDSLSYISRDPVHRQYHHDKLTFGLVYAFHENFVLPISHDEVVHGKGSMLGKMPGDMWQQFANLRLFYTYMYGHPGKKHLFMGGEIGQWQEWNHSRSLDWHLLEGEPHAKLQRFVRDLNRLYRTEPALYQADFSSAGFEWIDLNDIQHSVIAFQRHDGKGGVPLIFVCNFTPVPRAGYRIGVDAPGFYQEVLNSDSELYWGSNHGNSGGLSTEAISCHGRPYSLCISLPPLAAVVFKRRETSEDASQQVP